jgi:hypothetical protein
MLQAGALATVRAAIPGQSDDARIYMPPDRPILSIPEFLDFHGLYVSCGLHLYTIFLQTYQWHYRINPVRMDSNEGVSHAHNSAGNRMAK